jgi:hypothetical protein
VIIALIVVVAVVAARFAAPAYQRPFRFSSALACGVERWNIKTLKDKPLLLRARATTVTHLTSVRRPSYLPPRRRLLRERQILQRHRQSHAQTHRGDFDYHLVLRSGSRTMI